MFGSSHFDRVRQLFADQFQQDENGFLYRRNLKGAAIRVSDDEREAFIAAYNRRLKYASWSIGLATIVLIFLLVWLVPDVDSHAGTVATWVGLAAILLPFVAVHRWAWNAPCRELDRRTSEDDALTKEQTRDLAFSKIGYGQLVVAAVLGAGLIWRMSAETDLFHGWGMIWLLLGVALIVLSGVQAARKWHHTRFD